MAMTLLALYKRPGGGDEGLRAFWKRYREEHMPLIEKVPGLRGSRIRNVAQHYAGEDLIALTEMEFDDRAALDVAMASDEMRAAGRVLREIAPDLLTLVALEDAWA
ncbi:hypothetical protein BH23CHL7_BH23CHL7_04210 [soil metagenome]